MPCSNPKLPPPPTKETILIYYFDWVQKKELRGWGRIDRKVEVSEIYTGKQLATTWKY